MYNWDYTDYLNAAYYVVNNVTEVLSYVHGGGYYILKDHFRKKYVRVHEDGDNLRCLVVATDNKPIPAEKVKTYWDECRRLAIRDDREITHRNDKEYDLDQNTKCYVASIPLELKAIMNSDNTISIHRVLRGLYTPPDKIFRPPY